MQGSEVPKGIDAAGVGRFFARTLPELGAPSRFELISGGRSNLTYRVSTPGGDCVLRRPPLGHVLPTAHDMAREYRVLAALADSDVPVARPLALCEDAGVNGAPFYVMEYRPGVVLNERVPEGFATTALERRRISLALVDVLARLGAGRSSGRSRRSRSCPRSTR
jgi:aminoglycoside phosphotransferase (APT) family kinase protein